MLVGQSLNPDDDLTLFIRDALRFISAFMVPISQRAAHVYLSALPFAPEESHVARKFGSRFPNTFVVTQGKSSQWPMVVFTAEHHKDPVHDVAFSPDESTFCSTSFDAAYICDSETGHCTSGPFKMSGIYDARFGPVKKHILFKSCSYTAVWDIETGEEQFRVSGSDFAFSHHGGRIISVNEDGNSDGSKYQPENRILVQLWDASNGSLIPNSLLEVNDVRVAQFSPDGRFLAIVKRSGGVIELWNLEGSKHFRRFTHPHGNMTFLRFSPTSDTLMVGSKGKPHQVYIWRLDTQEMASFSHDFYGVPHVLHSPLTNYLFIEQLDTVEIWDVSATGSKMICEMKPTSTSLLRSICPSSDGHRLLVGYYDGSVRMWNVDQENLAENLAINQTDTMDTRDDADVRQVITISPSGKMIVTRSRQSPNVEFLATTTGEVIVRTDIEYEDDMEVAFSPDEEQVASWSKSLITIWDRMHPEKCVSFNPWARKSVWDWKVAFQTCNDLVVCGISRDDHSGLLQVWHRQNPANFECTYSLDFKIIIPRGIFLAPDGLTVIMPHSSSAKCYSWNHDTAQFDPVDFDDQVHVPWHPRYSPDGKILACWSYKDSHVRVWDTRTGHRISRFPTSWVDRIALSPALIDHSPGERLIALSSERENAIRLFDAYTGHPYVQILGQADAHMAFIRDGTALAYYFHRSGSKICDIADLSVDRWHSELMLQGIRDGWMMGQDNEPLFWVPVENRKGLSVPRPRAVIEGYNPGLL